ncbi:hypothetical protein PENTCL1PPCAC_1144, partial [Pristionchus entomophagus]
GGRGRSSLHFALSTMSWTVFLLPPLHTLVLGAADVDDELPGFLDKPADPEMETLAKPFLTMGVVNIVLSIIFALISCVFYTKYRSKGSDDKKKMRR